jgi:hypothetical protein
MRLDIKRDDLSLRCKQNRQTLRECVMLDNGPFLQNKDAATLAQAWTPFANPSLSSSRT